MRSLNKVMVIGNVGQEPDVRSTSNGTRIAKLSIATSRTWNDRNAGKQEKTEWHRVTAFGKLAEIVEKYVSKGDRIFVEGRIEYSTTEDDRGGKRYWTTIVAQELVMLGSSDGSRRRESSMTGGTPSHATADDDAFPF